MVNDYTTIKLPTSLLQRVKKAIEKLPELGFTNQTQFIKAAIQEKLQEIYPIVPITEKKFLR